MKKILSFCLVTLTFSIFGAITVFADEDLQSSWLKQKQTFTPMDNGSFELETTESQCYFTGNFSYDKEKYTRTTTKVKKGQVKSTTVTNNASYTAKAYINGAVVTFSPGQSKKYAGDVTVQDCGN